MDIQEGATFAKTFQSWVQAIVLIVGAIWGVYTFWLKEIIIPQSAPVNISMGMQTKKAGIKSPADLGGSKRYIAIEITISATNPGTRTVFLQSGRWIARGYSILPTSDKQYYESNRGLILSDESYYLQPGLIKSKPTLLALGGLFKEEPLLPKEVISRSIVIYAPENVFDHIEVDALQPTMSKYKGVEINWPDKDDMDYKLNLLPPTRKDSQGKVQELEPDNSNNYASDVELQYITSTASLSLW